MGTRGTSHRWSVALAACTALALAACSGSDTGGTAAEDQVLRPTITATTEPTPAAEPLERYAGHTSEIYADPANWLCRPDVADDVCDADLDATVVAADGTLTAEPWSADPDAPIDCFYVYPTISRDPTPYSDLVASPEEEGFAAINQVARLGQQCRVFAPVYRQRTLAGLAAALGPASPAPAQSPEGSPPADDAGATSTTSPSQDVDPVFADVLDAWQQYMAHDNAGRGVVLIGHSQGASLLTELITTEIDPNEDVRDRLVAAYLAGTSVAVPEGADVGGDFAHVPLCRNAEQFGCVVTWSSYRADAPPPEGAIFGRPFRDGVRAGCNSPAALAGGSAELSSYFPAAPGASILSALGASGGATEPWLDPAVGAVTTPFAATPGLVRAECVSQGGYDYLAVTVQGDPADPRVDDISGDLTPQWGLHLQDVNLVMGDIVALVGRQREAYAARR